MKFSSIILFMMFTTLQGQVIFSDTLGIGDNENSVESKTFTFNIGKIPDIPPEAADMLIFHFSHPTSW